MGCLCLSTVCETTLRGALLQTPDKFSCALPAIELWASARTSKPLKCWQQV